MVGEATVVAVHGGEEDDIKALRQLENDIAQAWVQRDTQTLDRFYPDKGDLWPYIKSSG